MKKGFGKIALTLVVTLLTGSLAGCGTTDTAKEDTTEKAESEAVATAEETGEKNYEGLTIRVGGCDFAIWNPQVNIAIHEGMFEEEFGDDGITVETYNFVNGPAGNEAMGADELDIFNGTGDQAFVTAVANEVPVEILSVTGQQGRGNLILVGADSGIDSAADLVGKRIGVFIGTQAQKTWLQYLVANGISGDDVEFVNLQSFTEQNAAFVNGDIDAFYASTYNYNTIKEENIKSIGNLGDFPNRCYITAREGFVDEYPELVQRFFNVLAKAQTFLEENPEKSYEYLAEDSGLSIEEVEQTMAEYDIYLSLDDDAVAGVEETYEFLLENGILETEIDDLKSHLNDTFVNNIQ